jgi:hypothetical protein
MCISNIRLEGERWQVEAYHGGQSYRQRGVQDFSGRGHHGFQRMREHTDVVIRWLSVRIRLREPERLLGLLRDFPFSMVPHRHFAQRDGTILSEKNNP